MFGYFSTKGFNKYLKRAKKILDGNWTGSYTKPSPSLYPHQWNWDSGFIAIGYSHYNQKRAEMELLSLFNAQWPNGMLPQIVLKFIEERVDSDWKREFLNENIDQVKVEYLFYDWNLNH